MNKTPRYTSALMALALICVSTRAAETPNPFTGRWALTIPGGGAGWLGIETSDSGPRAQILWGGGSVVPVTRAGIEGDTLTLERDHNIEQKDAAGKTITIKLTEKIIAEAKGDNLLLTQIWPHADGKDADRREFTGKRIPPMPPKPDLSKVKYADPIVLFDGADKNAWKLTNPSQTDGWSVQNGAL